MSFHGGFTHSTAGHTSHLARASIHRQFRPNQSAGTTALADHHLLQPGLMFTCNIRVWDGFLCQAADTTGMDAAGPHSNTFWNQPSNTVSLHVNHHMSLQPCPSETENQPSPLLPDLLCPCYISSGF